MRKGGTSHDNVLNRFAAHLSKHKTSLIIRHHSVTSEEPDDLFKYMMQLCAYHLEVQPLTSGRSGSVSGEVGCIHSMFTTSYDLFDQIALHAGLSLFETDIRTSTYR
jgi:hypothetical protein